MFDLKLQANWQKSWPAIGDKNGTFCRVNFLEETSFSEIVADPIIEKFDILIAFGPPGLIMDGICDVRDLDRSLRGVRDCKIYSFCEHILHKMKKSRGTSFERFWLLVGKLYCI